MRVGKETTKPAVLIVEDEPALARLYRGWLADTYAVEIALDGNHALEKIDGSIDVVLLDRRMPGLAGDDVLAHIRNEGLDVRVVIISAVTPDSDVIGMGFDEYLVKPVTSGEIHDVVERMLLRAEHDGTVQEWARLLAEKTTLEAEKCPAELQKQEAYRALQDRIETAHRKATASLAEFDAEDFRVAFRDLGENDEFKESKSSHE